MAAEAESVQELHKVNKSVLTLEITQKDGEVAKKLIELQKTLIDVRKELQGTDPAKYPFSSLIVNQAAKEVSNASILTEVKLNYLLIEVLRAKLMSKAITSVEEMDQEEKDKFYDDIAVFQAWFQNLHSLHAQHIQAFVSLLDEFIQNDSQREELVKDCVRKRMKCPEHDLPATHRSLDGKKLQCTKCITLPASPAMD